MTILQLSKGSRLYKEMPLDFSGKIKNRIQQAYDTIAEVEFQIDNMCEFSDKKKFIYICSMNKRDKILNRISSVIAQKYPDAEIYLYGSRARGDAKPFSDWDLLVLLNFPSVSFSLETNIMDDMYEIELETGEIISPLIYSKKEWVNKHKKTPLFENIEKESIKIK